jgi:hypothetical protein
LAINSRIRIWSRIALSSSIVRSSAVRRLEALGFRVTLEDRDEYQEVANEQGAQEQHEILLDE